MIGLPRQAVWAAALIIALSALVGLYEGWNRSASGPADLPSAVGAGIAASNTVGKAATAVDEPDEPIPEALTEARVRTLARQEIQSALNPQPKAAAAPAPGSLQPATPLTPAPALRPAAPAEAAADAALLSGARPPAAPAQPVR